MCHLKTLYLFICFFYWYSDKHAWHRGLMVRRCFPVVDLAEIAGSNPVGVEIFILIAILNIQLVAEVSLLGLVGSTKRKGLAVYGK